MKKKISFVFYLLIIFSTICTAADNTAGTLRIAACQFPVTGDIVENSQWIQKQIRQASKKGAQLVHFPECALSGYGGADIETMQVMNWDLLHIETRKIIDLANELDVWVLLGSTHRLSEGNKPHNSLYIINPDGQIINRYDKRFCTSGDLKYYTPGDHFVTFEINGITCGLLICYDLRFPELYRQYSKLGVQVMFHSFYNARHKKDCIHPKIMPVTAQARAGTNAMFVSLTNSSAKHSWPCYFITPDGLVESKLKRNKAGVLISDIDINQNFYDPSKPFRADAIDGKLNSGEIVDDPRSQDRSGY